MGILLIFASLAAGYCLVKQFLNFSRPLVSFCGAALVGCLLSGTTLYLIDFLCADFRRVFNFFGLDKLAFVKFN